MINHLGIVGQIYVGVFALSGLICLAAISRAQQFQDPDVRRGLVWLLATAGGWALLRAAGFLLPDPFRVPAYIIGLAIGFATVWAWLYFCSAYSGRTYHRNTPLRRASAGIFLSVIAIKATNPIHGAYFTAQEVSTPFAHLAVEHNVLHWTATGLSYVLSAVGLFMIFQLFFESGYDTRSLSVLSALIGLPVVFDIVAQFTPLLINIIYAPIGVAVFAVGVLFVFERRFLAVQRASIDDDLSIYLDERGRIRDYSATVREVLPELDGATGDQLSETVPSVVEALESNDQILERDQSGDKRYYFVSTSTTMLGEAGAQIILLSDVTQVECQRRELADREAELNAQNELYRGVIDASFGVVFRINEQGQCTFASPSVEKFLGYSPAELEGNPLSVSLPNEATVERAWDEIEPIFNGERNMVRDFPLKKKSGTTVFTDIRGVPIYEGSVPADERTTDHIIGIQLMVRDATKRREREGLISVINRVLRHNMRNKMGVITGYAEMLENRLSGEDAKKASQIRDTANQLFELTESAQRLEEYRDLSPDLEPIDITPMLEETVTELQMQYPEASVTINAPDTVVADTHERLKTALWEVVENAAKHGGNPPNIEIDVTDTETGVTIAVRDNGPGLPEIEQEVLESNEETPLIHGEGLGLWLIHWIVTSLDGELETTAGNEGTVVTICLPKVE
ncbi:ATP-binding protein [Halorubrum sp. SD626R]|jgi:PAS domain S-box-containing protein|uniref:sensor histidine kinase n=1 Tax=Halorubrum sp. SD626R TaxID=1419722 RepID=UPI000B18B562|nr:ATP-binding protein [Halorubrum sp. SD626R]TKX81825.1 PAS domain S-box protein [Halorubrum sp. SD626R]